MVDGSAAEGISFHSDVCVDLVKPEGEEAKQRVKVEVKTSENKGEVSVKLHSQECVPLP